MKNDVETIKAQMYGTSAIMVHSSPAINSIIPTHIAHPKHNLEPEDEPQGLLTNLVKGTIPSSPSFPASTPLAQTPTVAYPPPTFANPPHITVELPPKHIATYTSPCLTTSLKQTSTITNNHTYSMSTLPRVVYNHAHTRDKVSTSSCTTDRITANFNQVSK
ncbi:hypothetical protein Hdeb2414_s0008g00269221 [Helianthus debilis subsp. tardiflorus]